MADAKQVHDDDVTQLRAAIQRLSNEQLRSHMERALDAFHDTTHSTSDAAATQSQQTPSDRNDAIVVALRATGVKVTNPRDALFLAVHALLLESGFSLDGGSSSVPSSTTTTPALPLPENWDATASSGLFTARYRHAHDTSLTFDVQALSVGHKLELYLSTSTNKTHSLELSIDAYVVQLPSTTTSTLAADVVSDVAALRQRVVPFLAAIVPSKPVAAAPATHDIARPSPSPSSPQPPPFFPGHDPLTGLPAVGSGDVLPPGLGGGDPGMLVGPDSALFRDRLRYDPSHQQGPVPGARFDPFGPSVIDPLRVPGPGRSIHPRPGAGPSGLPFGAPNPDHLRMPRDDDDDAFGAGFGGGGGRQSGSGFGGSSSNLPPFGSGHSFF